MTNVVRQDDVTETESKRVGWKVYVTDVSGARLCFVDALNSYRNEYRIEKIFDRLKRRWVVSSLFVKRDDPFEALANLLTPGVRLGTLIQNGARRSLAEIGTPLMGLHLEKAKKATNTSTCERILRASSKIYLPIIETSGNIIRHITPLSSMQTKNVELPRLNATIYSGLAKLAKPLRC